jgi:glycosyltransferase involved in cell wall biosynthesis
MRKVLLVAPYFPPRRRVGAVRPFRFAAGLSENGWSTAVLTLTSGGELTTLEKKRLQQVQRIEVGSPVDRTTVSHGKSEKSATLADGLASWIDRQTPADTWIYLFLIHYRNIRRRVKQIDPDIIWATGDPWSGLWLGKKLAVDLNLPWIADFRDPWTQTDMNLRQRSLFSERMDRRIESDVIRKANHVVFTSRTALEKYQQVYPELTKKGRVIYNSFGTDQTETDVRNLQLPAEQFHLMFFGRFRRLSPVGSVINVLSELRAKQPELLKTIRIHSFGQPDDVETDIIESSGFSSNFVVHDPVPPEMSLHMLDQADLLLVSTHPQRENVVPAKLWEYLASGKPVLSLVPNKEVGEILRETGKGTNFLPDQTTQTGDYLNTVIRRKMSGEDVFSQEENRYRDIISSYSSDAAVQKLSELLETLLAD